MSDEKPGPRLSVIMPVFKEEHTVLGSLDRVLAQPFVRDVVVVNDAATDGTAYQLATYVNPTDMEACYKVFRQGHFDAVTVEENRFGFEPEITVKMMRGIIWCGMRAKRYTLAED
jgi:glycosyltransferase involved in cell wall biosynthesis